ncbi:MAG: phosphomannomutase/phosphoglucomutase [Ruminococcus sp.]|nr:phosphomannomutase/phosphoglucomutase [Ruminococcus sp.]
MLNEYFSHLKSGTDIRGVACEGVKGEEINLTDDVVKGSSKGFIKFISEKSGKKPSELLLSVGHDSRITGEHIASLVIEEFSKAGARVLDCGLATTPSMFMTTVDLNCDGAVEITASHHPFNRNGLKFFTPDGGLEAEDIEQILQFAQDGGELEKAECGTVEKVNYMEQYAENLCNIIRKAVDSEDYMHPLKDFKIVVDAGNGVGGFYADKVLKPLGADTEGSKFLEPDGMFPNHIPNPEDKTAMDSICKAVVDSNADLGVIFDTDVDRGGAVDSTGKEINRNRLVALASAIALEGNEGGTIVTDSITSSGLKEFIENTLGGKHYRYKRGYKNVIDKGIELNSQGINCPLAIETSGHAAMRENYFLDDGAYLCTKIIIKMAQMKKQGKALESILQDLKEPVESREYRFNITEKDFRACGEKIIKDLEEFAQKQDGWILADDSREGVRVSFGKNDGDGWFLLRLSVHDPNMPLNIESDTKGGAEIIYRKFREFLVTTRGLEY